MLGDIAVAREAAPNDGGGCLPSTLYAALKLHSGDGARLRASRHFVAGRGHTLSAVCGVVVLGGRGVLGAHDVNGEGAVSVV